LDNPAISLEEGEALLIRDLQRLERAVMRIFPVPLIPGQYYALVSFSCNLGASTLQSSTLRRKIMRENYEGAADEFPRWLFAAGRRVAGLVRRREAKRALFLS